MIPPSCHSNGFSEIYGTGQKVCNMDVGGVAFTNHPGGTGTDTPADKRGWRAWKTTFGMNVEASKAMIATDEYPFWLFSPLAGGTPDMSVGSVTEYPNDPDKRQTIHYINWLNPWAADEMSFDLTWDETNKAIVKAASHVFWLQPRCDRLLLAQNVRLVNKTSLYDWILDMSHASIAWYAPRKIDKFDSGEDTDLRPYRAPRSSVKGVEGNNYVLDPNPDQPYYSLTPGGEIVNPQYIHVENPPFGCDDWGDWRCNPKRAQDIERGTDLEKVTVPAMLVKHAAKNQMRLEEALPGYMPETGYEDWWEDPCSWIMLYGVSIRRDEINGVEVKKCRPLYWKKVPINAPNKDNQPDYTDGARIDSQDAREAIAERLRGVLAYSGTVPPILRVPVDNNGKTHHFGDDIDFTKAFDLRMYCKRYDWVARRLIADPNNPGEKIIDRSEPKTRGYFNTKCWASVRQISPTPPRV